MKKRKSPIVDLIEVIQEEVQCLRGDLNVRRSNHIGLLRDVEWNLKKAWEALPGNVHLAQALGYVRGALRELGEQAK